MTKDFEGFARSKSLVYVENIMTEEFKNFDGEGWAISSLSDMPDTMPCKTEGNLIPHSRPQRQSHYV